MDKLNMKTANIADENFKKLSAMFPNAVTETITGYDEEGNAIIEHCIDKDILMQEINCKVVDGKEERYQFTWPDKRKAILAANSPISETLRPCKEESVGKDGTKGGFDSENLYIEGDNLDVLKLLQETYLGKIKMIFIDPPYNTGSDLIYDDDFQEDAELYFEKSGQFDSKGNKLVQNLETNGKFHTDWLNMIYPRLKIARNLLMEDGIIFITIDDNEVFNLKKVCDELFGANNFVTCIVWQKKTSPDARMDISSAHDYILVYTKFKNPDKKIFNALPYDGERLASYTNPDNDPRGVWASVDITGQTGRAPKSQFYEITTPAGVKYLPPEGRCWAMAEYTFNELYKDNRLWFGADGKNRPRLKKFLSESEGQRPWTWWDNKFASYNQASNKELMKLFDGKLVFDNPKPVKLILKMLDLVTKKNENHIIMDFFSGSGTTAEAVIQANANDSGNRKFICVQLNNELKDTGNDFKANNVALQEGFKSISEIGKERIRRAGAKIREENALTAGDLDTGFRVLKLDSTNMKDVYYNPEEVTQSTLDGLIDNIKGDRTNEDLLFQTMLELGVPLSSTIKEEKIGGVTVFNVGEENFLIATFDSGVTDDVVKQIAQKKPYYFVVRDSSMDSDAVAANFEQIFKTYSPDTKRKVL